MELEQKKRYAYYAIRTGGMVNIRKTLNGLQIVQSTLYKANGTFKISQLTYVGGISIGAITVLELRKRVGPGIVPAVGGYKQMERTTVRALKPFLKGS